MIRIPILNNQDSMESQAVFFVAQSFFASQQSTSKKNQTTKTAKKNHQVDHTKPIAYTEFINKAIGDPAFDAIKPLSEILFVASLRAVSGFSAMSLNAVAIVQ